MLRHCLVALVACGGPQIAPPPRACGPETVVVLRGQTDVAAAAGCVAIAKLTIRTGAPLDLLPLRKLQVVFGDLVVGPTVGFDELRLADLQSVGTLRFADNGNLHGVFLPKLATAGSLTIESNVALTTVSTPLLSKLTGDLRVTDNGGLELVEMSSLAMVEGELRIEGNPNLTLLELAKLERAREVHVANNRALAADVVDALRAKAAP